MDIPLWKNRIERGVDLHNSLKALENDLDWQQFCRFMELWDRRAEAIDPKNVPELEKEMEEQDWWRKEKEEQENSTKSDEVSERLRGD